MVYLLLHGIARGCAAPPRQSLAFHAADAIKQHVSCALMLCTVQGCCGFAVRKSKLLLITMHCIHLMYLSLFSQQLFSNLHMLVFTAATDAIAMKSGR